MSTGRAAGSRMTRRRDSHRTTCGAFSAPPRRHFACVLVPTVGVTASTCEPRPSPILTTWPGFLLCNCSSKPCGGAQISSPSNLRMTSPFRSFRRWPGGIYGGDLEDLAGPLGRRSHLLVRHDAEICKNFARTHTIQRQPDGMAEGLELESRGSVFLVAAVFLLLVERSVLVVAPMHHLVQDRAVHRFDEQVHVVCPVVERFFEQVEERCVDADLID